MSVCGKFHSVKTKLPRNVNLNSPNPNNLAVFDYSDINTAGLSVSSAYNGTVRIPYSTINSTCNLAAKVNYGGHQVTFYVYVLCSGSNQNGPISYQELLSILPNIDFSAYKIATVANISSPTQTEKYHINALFGAIIYYDFLFRIFGRVGIFNASHSMVSFVNIDMTNAFYYAGQMFYGNGDSDFSPLTTVDICCHEMTHGLVEQTIGLQYSGESGAIDESIADIFGTFMEFYINSPVDVPDWTIGEECTKPAIRSMSDPLSFYNPDVYKGRYWVNTSDTSESNDYGGVHTNSGVLNFLCYICVCGINNYCSSIKTTINVAKDPNFTFLSFITILYNTLINNSLSSRPTMDEFARAMENNAPSQNIKSYLSNNLKSLRLIKSNSSPLTCCGF